MKNNNIAKLNERGIKMYEGIFENDEIPITYILPEKSELCGLGSREVYYVDIENLNGEVFKALCLKISKLHDSEYINVKKYFQELGFIPLRKELTAYVYSKVVFKYM